MYVICHDSLPPVARSVMVELPVELDYTEVVSGRAKSRRKRELSRLHSFASSRSFDEGVLGHKLYVICHDSLPPVARSVMVELPVELDSEELYAIGQSNCQSNCQSNSIIQKWCRGERSRGERGNRYMVVILARQLPPHEPCQAFVRLRRLLSRIVGPGQ